MKELKTIEDVLVATLKELHEGGWTWVTIDRWSIFSSVRHREFWMARKTSMRDWVNALTSLLEKGIIEEMEGDLYRLKLCINCLGKKKIVCAYCHGDWEGDRMSCMSCKKGFNVCEVCK